MFTKELFSVFFCGIELFFVTMSSQIVFPERDLLTRIIGGEDAEGLSKELPIGRNCGMICEQNTTDCIKVEEDIEQKIS